MRRIPSRQSTRHGPASARRRVASRQNCVMPSGDSTMRASRPASSPRYRAISRTSTASSPPQLLIVAGTAAAASSPGVCAKMSSSWIGTRDRRAPHRDGNRLTGEDHVEQDRGQPAVVAVGRVHARDRGRESVGLGREAGHCLLRDLRDAVGRRVGLVADAERIAFAHRVRANRPAARRRRRSTSPGRHARRESAASGGRCPRR